MAAWIKALPTNKADSMDSKKPTSRGISGGQGFGPTLEEYNYKLDSLKRIHTQGSADTSGLGDSLQRIHAFSSTETSGYGEGGSPSPETQKPMQQGSQGGEERGVYEEGNISGLKKCKEEKSSNQWGIAGVEQDFGGKIDAEDRGENINNSVYRVSNVQAPFSVQKGRNSISLGGDHSVLRKDFEKSLHHEGSHKNKFIEVPRITLQRSHSMDSEVNSIMSSHYGKMSGYRDPPSSLRKSGSQNSIRSKNYFFGKEMSSTWLKWSQERRVSFKRRMREMEDRQKELEEQRMSTPVRKARIESVKFVCPELEGEHVPEDEDLHVHERLQSYMPPPKSRKREDKDEMKLSNYHWMALVMFWEHPLFIRCRVGAIVLGSLALIITVISLTNQKWSHYKDHTLYGASYSGLWLICSTGVQNNCTSTFHRDWQYAVIGLLIFTIAFGFLATMLAVCGVCSTSLPRKLYYYHSAGEIYLICAISTLSAVLIYPLAIKTELQHATHQHGLGFVLAWVSVFVFVGSALCMCLDEIMRAAIRFWQAVEEHSDTRV